MSVLAARPRAAVDVAKVPFRPLSVLKVYDGDYPWDVRVEKMCQAFTDAGHDVHLLARNNAGAPLVERRPEAAVHRLAPLTGPFARFSRASMFPAFFNPRWLRAIQRTARSTRADVIVVRDLPLAPSAIWVARRLGIPMVLDMAENYPQMLRSRWSTGRRGALDVLVRNPALARLVEQWTLPRADGIMVVVEESAERVLGEGVRPEHVTVVGNTPPLTRLQAVPARQDGATLEVVYLGILELQRGIGTLIDAIAILDQEDFPVRLTIFGDGLDAALLREQTARLGLGADRVVFRGRVENNLALAQLPGFHVGVIPHWKDVSWDTTIPNKLFDYMAAGLAVVTSNCIPTTRVVNTAKCGRVYPDRAPAALAAALRDLGEPATRKAAGRHGWDAVRTTYHWERDVQRMLDLVRHATVSRPRV